MTAVLSNRGTSSLWARFCEWITSTENRLYIGWFGVLMIPCLLTATSVFIIGFIAAPPVDIDGIREPVSGSLLYGNNIISGAIIPTSNAIGLHFYPIWEAASLDEWLYNGGPYQMIVLHFLLGVASYMGFFSWPIKRVTFCKKLTQLFYSYVLVINMGKEACRLCFCFASCFCCSLFNDQAKNNTQYSFFYFNCAPIHLIVLQIHFIVLTTVLMYSQITLKLLNYSTNFNMNFILLTGNIPFLTETNIDENAQTMISTVKTEIANIIPRVLNNTFEFDAFSFANESRAITNVVGLYLIINKQ